MAWDEVEIDGRRYYCVEGTIGTYPPGSPLGVSMGAPWLPTETWTGARAPGDIIDRIDELVDEQMAGGEPRQGYDFNDPTYPKCPHCDRHWHGLPVTERIGQMYGAGRFDESYRVDEDDSTVLCEGSDFIGPVRATALLGSTGWLDRLARGIGTGWREMAATTGWHVIGTLVEDGVTLTDTFERSTESPLGYSYRGFGMSSDATWSRPSELPTFNVADRLVRPIDTP